MTDGEDSCCNTSHTLDIIGSTFGSTVLVMGLGEGGVESTGMTTVSLVG